MNDQDIIRLSKGIKLKKQIESLNAQILAVGQVNIIKLFKTKEWNKTHEQINFDIPLDNSHPYSDKAKDFLNSYIEYLNEKIVEVQNEFDGL